MRKRNGELRIHACFGCQTYEQNFYFVLVSLEVYCWSEAYFGQCWRFGDHKKHGHCGIRGLRGIAYLQVCAERESQGLYTFSMQLKLRKGYTLSNCFSLTLCAHVQEGYSSWSVCVCVCLSHFGASICPENTVTYSADSKGRKEWGLLRNSSIAKFQHSLH